MNCGIAGHEAQHWLYAIKNNNIEKGKPIWTEEEELGKAIDNMINFKGKSCKNCVWGSWEKGRDFVTCGHHYDNFLASSFCTYWTDPKDPKFLKAAKESKERVRAKLKAKGLIK